MPLAHPRRLLAVLFALLGLTAAGLAQRAPDRLYRPTLTDKDIEPTLRTDWYGVYLKGQKIGYVRSDRHREGNTVVERQLMAMKLISFGKKAEMTSTQTTVFQAAAPHPLPSAE